MEVQLQEFIDRIKKDGINEAAEEAAKILEDAGAQAARILDMAKKEAADIVSRGKTEAERLEKTGIAALQQASRTLILVFKGEVETLLNKIIADAAVCAYNEDTLKTVLPDILRLWASKDSPDSLDLLLGEKQLENLKSWALGALSRELDKGVELKSARSLEEGFRIAGRDGSVYYDFSASSVAQLLSAYLNPYLADVLAKSVEG